MKISVSDGIDNFTTVDFPSVRELAQQACKSNISTSVFKDGKRNIDSFEYAECIGLDIDNEKDQANLTIEEAVQTFAGIKHVILTTRSHRKEKNGHVADRFRIILFLETPITNANDFYATWFSLKAKYPWIDQQCKDPSRFWYRHSGIHSGQDGALIKPVKYVAPVKPEKEVKTAVAGERGELSRATLNLLEFGTGLVAGSRNAAVYKAAREFNQNLYEHEEAEDRIVSALTRNNKFDNGFTEEEVKLTIASAYKRDAKHEPRLEEQKPRAFKYIGLGDLLDREDEQEHWLVDGVLIKGGVSIMVGQPKIGKTTIIRQLEKNVLRGEKFLDRAVVKGSVLHYSFDEKARTAKRHYKTLGLTKEDPMYLHFGVADNEDYKLELEEDLLRLKPSLVVVDTLFDMVNSEDVNSYGPIKRELAFFNSLAEKTNCHIMFIHHQNKPNKEYGSGSGHSVLGSTAIFGSVDCCLIFERDSANPEKRIISAMGRGVDGFEKKSLKFDKYKQTYSIDEVEF